MILILFLALSLSIPIPSTLLKSTSLLADVVHQKCTQSLPKNLNELSALNSLLCGEKITDQKLQNKLLLTSLIHLFVISGSHLILIDHLFSKMALPFLVRFLVLSVYSLIALAQPPVIRALISMGARQLSRNTGWFWSGDVSVLLTGVFTLFLFPDWWDSLSLQLSWAASLALCVPGLFQVRKALQKICILQLAVFIFLIPLLWGFGSLHPLSLVFNIFLGPVIGFLLLPLGVLVTVIPSLGFIFDHTIQIFQSVMQAFSDPIQMPQDSVFSRSSLWIWIGFLHLGFYFLRLRLYQGKDSSL